MISSVLTATRNLASRSRACICEPMFSRSIHSSLPNTARHFVRALRASRDFIPKAPTSLHHGLADEPTIKDRVSGSSSSPSPSPSVASRAALLSSKISPSESPALLDAVTVASGRVDKTLFVAGIEGLMRERHLTEYFEDLGIVVRDAFVPSAYNKDGQKRKNNRGFGFIEVGSVKEHQQLLKLSKNENIEFDLKPAKWDIEEARSFGTKTSPDVSEPEPKKKKSRAKPDYRVRSKPTVESEGEEKKKPKRRRPFLPRGYD